jgi:hypothetical protein
MPTSATAEAATQLTDNGGEAAKGTNQPMIWQDARRRVTVKSDHTFTTSTTRYRDCSLHIYAWGPKAKVEVSFFFSLFYGGGGKGYVACREKERDGYR